MNIQIEVKADKLVISDEMGAKCKWYKVEPIKPIGNTTFTISANGCPKGALGEPFGLKVTFPYITKMGMLEKDRYSSTIVRGIVSSE